MAASHEVDTASLHFRLLGGFRVVRDERTLAAPSTRKALFLAAYLAMLNGRTASREALCAFLWSDRSGVQARGSLRQALASLKRLYGDDILADQIGIALSRHCVVDALKLIAAASRNELAEQLNAAALYDGPFLAGYDAPDRGAEDWLRVERERVQRAAVLILDRIVDGLGSNPAWRPAASGLAERLLSHDPACEEAHRALIAIALAEGRTTAALRQYETCCEALRRTLDAVPETKTRELVDEARRQHEPAKAGPDPQFRSEADGRALRTGPSLVVLPFDDLGGAGDALIAGVEEEITGALARMRDFFVIARQSAYAFKGQARDAREIGDQLGVRYVVQGSVRRSGEHVRITAQLIDAETGAHLWAERFGGEIRHLFDFQDAIAAQIAGALHPSLRAAEIKRARKKAPDVVEAYDLVMRAYPHLWAHTQTENAQAIDSLERALQLDPRYGLATALLAWCHSQDAAYLWSSVPTQSHEIAVQLARRAAMLVEEDATAMAAIGTVEMISSGDLELARTFIDRALTIDPNHAWAWLRDGWLHYYAGEPEEALKRFERALALSPFDPFVFNIYIGMGGCYVALGDPERGIGLVEKGIRSRPGMAWAYRALVSFAMLVGDVAKAQEALAVFLAEYPGMTIAKMRDGVPKPLLQQDGYWERLRAAGLPER